MLGKHSINCTTVPDPRATSEFSRLSATGMHCLLNGDKSLHNGNLVSSSDITNFSGFLTALPLGPPVVATIKGVY